MKSAPVAALEASLRLHDLLRGPVELIRPTVYTLYSIAHRNMALIEANFYRSMRSALNEYTKFDNASKVPIHGEILIVELAK